MICPKCEGLAIKVHNKEAGETFYRCSWCKEKVTK